MAKLEYLKLTKYFFADPASGKTQVKRVRARQAIVGVATDHLTRIFCCFAWTGRLPTSALKNKILDTYEKYQPRLFGIEANAMQELFGDLVRDEARRRFGKIRMVPVYQPTKLEKDFRIRTALEPVLADGRLFVPGKKTVDGTVLSSDTMINELIKELRGFPTAATKDLVDALASAISLVPKRAVEQTRKDEIDELARYLRNSGLPGHLIERRIAEVQGEVNLLH